MTRRTDRYFGVLITTGLNSRPQRSISFPPANGSEETESQVAGRSEDGPGAVTLLAPLRFLARPDGHVDDLLLPVWV